MSRQDGGDKISRTALDIIKEKRDSQPTEQMATSNRLSSYFMAIENGTTEKHWDLRDCRKKRMSWKDFHEKWDGKKMGMVV